MSNNAETITWLHLSDLHQRRPGTTENEAHLLDAQAVLERLLEDIQRLIQEEGLQPDFIVFTGDIAFSADPDEYGRADDAQDDFERAADFFDKLLQTTHLAKKNLFVVPGNHDVSWKIIDQNDMIAAGCANKLRSQWNVNRFFTPAQRDNRIAAFRKFENYVQFIQEYFDGALPFGEDDYFYVKHLPLRPTVAILGLNSAWMSGFVKGKNGKFQDRGNLLIGRRQVEIALEQAEKTAVRIALMHHPFDWLQDFDRRAVETELLKECNFILRGHQHQPDFGLHHNPDASTLVIPAGACYHRREYRGDGEYNGYNLVRLDFSSGKGTILWRRYYDIRGGRWAADVGLFDEAPQGRYEFDLSERLRNLSTSPAWMVETIPIPSGDFWMGSDPYDREAHDNERPQHSVELPGFEIGKYPVTNAQYHTFVQATGYQSPIHWEHGRIPSSKENHPVVNVSLKDAQTFCDWLTERIGQTYRLPTEAEWEKAARGGYPDRRRYPWGDEWIDGAANTREAGYSDTTPVDAFEERRSPFEVVDMAGNVWEWTSSLYEKYPDSNYSSSNLGKRYRVVRGGSYYEKNDRSHARVSCRGRYRSGARRPYLGFRIVRSSLEGEE